MTSLIWAAAIAFAVPVLAGPWTIDRLKQLKAGQVIRSEGPKRHLEKAGVPTMGGILIIIGTVVASLAATGWEPSRFPGLFWALFVFIGFGLIGLTDDLIKVVQRRSLGLTARQKLLAQLLLSLVLGLYMMTESELGTRISIPFADRVSDLPWWLFLPLVAGVMIGSTNAVNLTDGLDGLAAGAMTVASVVYAVWGVTQGIGEVAILATSVAGASLGFIWFNAHPAQVIMGDTGSLALGAALGSMAVLSGSELILPLIGGLFVMETLSVIVQVIYFRLSGGRRVFRMSPIHHHFELGGWKETQVVVRFWIVGVVCGAAGLWALFESAPF